LHVSAALVIAVLFPVFPIPTVLVITIPIPVIAVTTHSEISPASVIYPDTLIV
jgi:hypothetical protein